MPLRNSTVDVFLASFNQVFGDRSGPVGRIKSIKNGVATHYDAGNGRPRRVVVQQRTAFDSLTTTGHNSETGVTETVAWANPELLAAAGDQALSIANAIPRVYDGTDWTHYGAERVVSNILSESVFHTSQRVITAPDSAWANGVTCSVWVEIPNPQAPNDVLYVGFKSDDGTWVRTPTIIYDPNAEGDGLYTSSKVIADDTGTYFWVVYARLVLGSPTFRALLFDLNGQQIDSEDVDRNQVTAVTAAWWDITAVDDGGCFLAQPLHPTQDTTDGVTYSLFTQAAGVISVDETNDGDVHCRGKLAWVTNDIGDGYEYLATIGLGEEPGGRLWGYQVDPAAPDPFLHEYNFAVQAPATDTLFDSLIGFVKVSTDPAPAPYNAGGANVLWIKGDFELVDNGAGKLLTQGNAADPTFNPGLRQRGVSEGPEVGIDTLDGIPGTTWTTTMSTVIMVNLEPANGSGAVHLKDRNDVNFGYDTGETQTITWLAVVIARLSSANGGTLGGTIFRLGNTPGGGQLDLELIFRIFVPDLTPVGTESLTVYSNDWTDDYADAVYGPSTPAATYDGIPLLLHFESGARNDLSLYVSGPGIGTMVPVTLSPGTLPSTSAHVHNQSSYGTVDIIASLYDRWVGARFEDLVFDVKLTGVPSGLTQTYAYLGFRYPSLALDPV